MGQSCFNGVDIVDLDGWKVALIVETLGREIGDLDGYNVILMVEM